MKIYLSLIFILIFTLIEFGQNAFHPNTSDLGKAGYRGKVKSIDIFTSSFDPQDGWSNRRPWVSETYNLKGNTAERIVFRDGIVISKVVTFYDALGRNTGNDSYDKTLTQPTKTEFILDDVGNAVQMNVYYTDKSKLTYTYTYDAKGNQIEKNYGPKIGKSVSTFDTSNNLTSIVNSDGTGKIYNKTFVEYNEHHQKIKASSYESEILRYETTYKYDAQGRLSEVEIREFNIIPNLRSSHAPKPGKTVYIYNEKDNTYLTTIYLLSGELSPNSTTIFNQEGKQIGMLCENNELKSCKYTFDYQTDTQGNVTKKTWFTRSSIGGEMIPYSAEEKVFTYY